MASGLQGLVCWRPAVRPVLAMLPLALLVVHFPQLDLSHDFSVRARAQAVLDASPPNAAIFGNWHDIVPVEYLYRIEGQRPDLGIYNLFLFRQPDLQAYIRRLVESRRPVAFINSQIENVSLADSRWAWIFSAYAVQTVSLPTIDGVPLRLFLLSPR
jgi:hypothetical protein